MQYLNARPLIHGWPGAVVLDHPTALAAQLERGELEAALVSSFEFLQHPRYHIVDGLSISSHGPVYSVVVAHREPLAELRAIELDPASLTSGNLLRCLLRHFHKLEPELCATMSSESRMPPRGVGRLLIGDQALRFRREFGRRFRYLDLGADWHRCTGRPFVYALWLIRPEFAEAHSLAEQLRAHFTANLAALGEIIDEQREFDRAFIADYYTKHLHFQLGDPEKAGLQLFAELCQKHGLLPRANTAFDFV